MAKREHAAPLVSFIEHLGYQLLAVGKTGSTQLQEGAKGAVERLLTAQMSKGASRRLRTEGRG